MPKPIKPNKLTGRGRIRTEDERIDLYAGFDDFCRGQIQRIVRTLNLQRGARKYRTLDEDTIRRIGIITDRGIVRHYQGEKHDGQA